MGRRSPLARIEGNMHAFKLTSGLGLSSLWTLNTVLFLLCGCGKGLLDAPGDAVGTQTPTDAGVSEKRTAGNLLGLFATPTGAIQTFSTTGEIDTENAFFQSLGSNGRRCDSCHQASDGWTITPAHVRARFESSEGLDPLFRKNDGANSPQIDDSTLEARRSGYSMLLSKALIRVGIAIPEDAE